MTGVSPVALVRLCEQVRYTGGSHGTFSESVNGKKKWIFVWQASYLGVDLVLSKTDADDISSTDADYYILTGPDWRAEFVWKRPWDRSRDRYRYDDRRFQAFGNRGAVEKLHYLEYENFEKFMALVMLFGTDAFAEEDDA